MMGLVIYLFVKGALVMRPRETVTALTTLIAALVQSCCGSAPTTSSPRDGASLEERRQGDLVRDGQRDERGERHVDAAVLDDAQVLGVKPGQFGGLLLRQSSLFAKLSKPQPKPALRPLDRFLKGRPESDLGGTVLARETFERRHVMGLREVGHVLHKTSLESMTARPVPSDAATSAGRVKAGT
jgi:hypothetical protein